MNTARMDRLEMLVSELRGILTPERLERLENQLTPKERARLRKGFYWFEFAQQVVTVGAAGATGGLKLWLALKMLAPVVPFLLGLLAKYRD